MIHKIGERYTTIKITATTPSVVSKSVESIVPKAAKRSPKSPPGPVTYGSTPFASAIGAISSRSASTIAGSTGSSFGRTFPSAVPSSGILASIAAPSSDGKTVIC